MNQFTTFTKKHGLTSNHLLIGIGGLSGCFILFSLIAIGALVVVARRSPAPVAVAPVAMPEAKPEQPKGKDATIYLEHFAWLKVNQSISHDTNAYFGNGDLIASGGGMGGTSIEGAWNRAQSPTTDIYRWTNPDGSSLTATFRGDVLIAKSQIGLKHSPN